VGYTKTEFLDSKPHTKGNGEIRKRALRYMKKKKAKIHSSSPSMLQIFNRSPSRSHTGESYRYDFQGDAFNKDTLSKPPSPPLRRAGERFAPTPKNDF
jgi:hypothetical protein